MKSIRTGCVVGVIALFLATGFHPTLSDDSLEMQEGTLQCYVTHPDGRVTLIQRALPLLGILVLKALFEKLKTRPQWIPGLIGILERAGIVPGDMARDFHVRLFTYGEGDIYIPDTDRGEQVNAFWGVMLRPIIYNYDSPGITWVWHAGILSPAKSFWGKLGRQRGVVIGFHGLCIKLSHPLSPDTHLMLGKSLLIFHQDLPL